MQNTVVVHVQSFAVFARPIAVAVVDISSTTKERNKLEQEISREEVMKYLTNGVRQKSPEILTELLINKITIWDDHIEIEFNYSNNINPDEHETVRRDFSISRNLYVMIATNCVLIASRQLLYDAHYLQVAQTTLQDYSVS